MNLNRNWMNFLPIRTKIKTINNSIQFWQDCKYNVYNSMKTIYNAVMYSFLKIG